jgi:hypothetical protein
VGEEKQVPLNLAEKGSEVTQTSFQTLVLRQAKIRESLGLIEKYYMSD